MQPVIKWSGSKRSQAKIIKSFIPNDYEIYYEPFIGGGSMLYTINPEKAVCGDVCAPLIELWNMIKKEPQKLNQEYELRWNRLQEEGYTAFYDIRDKYNKFGSPFDLLFLSRTCVNGLIRFNAKGEFNNSLHHSRPGIHPDRLRKIIDDWSINIQNAIFQIADYRTTTSNATASDIVYLDPPYFHTRGRYYGTIAYEEFIQYLEDLNDRGVRYLLSFDGKRGDLDYTVELPQNLYKRHEYIPSGNSTFKKVIDKEREQVYESLYMNY